MCDLAGRLLEAVLQHPRVDLMGYRPAVVHAALAERLVALVGAPMAPADYLQRLDDGAGGEDRALLGAIEQQGCSAAANPLADGLSLHTLAAAWPVLGVRPGRQPAFKIWLPACPDPTPAQMLAQWLAQQPRPASAPSTLQPLVLGAALPDPEVSPGWELHASSAAVPPDVQAAPWRWHVHHALHDPPLPGCDLIVCHSALAPLQPEARRHVLRRFARALAPHGMLWLDESARELAAELGLVPVGHSLIYRCSTAAAARLPRPRSVWVEGRDGARIGQPTCAAAVGAASAHWSDPGALHAEVGARLARRPAVPVTVLAIGLDHHGDLRQRFGHMDTEQIIDAAGRDIADQVQTVVGADGLGAMLARSAAGGWIVLLSSGLAARAALPLVRQLQARLRRPLSPDAPALSWSAGVSVGVGQAGTAARLIHQAEAALLGAGQRGPAGLALCGPALSRALDRQALVVAELPSAVANGQLLLHYQPQFDVVGGGLVGVEALVRWRHPERGLVMPDDFIPPAEAAGLIAELGDWVLREACRQARDWQRLGLPAVPVAVNVSFLQLAQADFVERVAAALAGADLAPHWLELELTEGALMREPAAAQARLAHCRELGVRVSLDDFGTGYSSLGALHCFEVDRLKIDRSFLAALPGDRRAGAVVRSIIGLARDLGLQVVAEGVESSTQLDWLRSAGCHAYQGHLRAPALEPAAAQRHLRNARAAVP